MKTAVNIPDAVVAAADRVAKRARISRSELYARALRSYVKTRPSRKITSELNRLYAKVDSRLGPVIEKMQSDSLREDHW